MVTLTAAVLSGMLSFGAISDFPIDPPKSYYEQRDACAFHVDARPCVGDTTMIDYSIPENGKVKITLYNLLGDPHKTLVDSTLEKGPYTAPLILEKRMDNAYFLEFTLDGKIINTKLIRVLDDD